MPAPIPFFPVGVAATMSRCVGLVCVAANSHMAQGVLLGYKTSVFEIVTLLDPNEQSAGRHTDHPILPFSWSRLCRSSQVLRDGQTLLL